MELNREQVEKALECCTSPDGDDTCLLCPYGDINLCTQSLMAHALALINSQEQKIKELTEENERLRTDNEILKMPRATIFEIADAFDRGRKKGKSDTVRKMQEETKKTISALCKGDVSEILKIVDQIAKEMLEGEK